MATWKKAILAVFLSSFIVQAVPAVDTQIILPAGYELSEEELFSVEGERFDLESGSGGFGAPWIIGVPWLVQWINNMVQTAKRIWNKIADFFFSHSTATNTIGGGIVGGVQGGLQSREETTLGKLKDASIGIVIGATSFYGLTRLTLKTNLTSLPKWGPLNDPDGNIWGE